MPLNDQQVEETLEAAALQAQRRDATRAAQATSIGSVAGAFVGGIRPHLISEAEDRRRQERQREMESAAHRKQMLAEARIPRRYVDARLDDASRFPREDRAAWLTAVEQLRPILDSDSIFILAGPRGPGKTHLACAVVRAFCESGRSARYGKALDYLTELKATYSPAATRDEIAVEREWSTPHLIVLDEIQERHDSTFEDVKLPRLIDLRYDQLRPTLIVTNKSAEQLDASLGTSIMSRADDGGAVIICEWPSVRGRLARATGGQR